MSHGNMIVLNSDPLGTRLEGTVSGTPTPGLVMEIFTTALANGRPTYRVYQPGTDGYSRPMIVSIPNPFNGMLATDAYASGDHGFFYVPRPGEELNMVVKNLPGTGTNNSHAIGDLFMANSGTGKLVVSTNTTGGSDPFVCLEPVTVELVDTLLMCMFTGY